jgi:hypothetical protein
VLLLFSFRIVCAYSSYSQASCDPRARLRSVAMTALF